MDVKNCIAAVTGGASGLGEATVMDLLQRGAKVAIFDFDAEKGEALAERLGTNTVFCKTDVSDENSVQEAIQNTVSSFGGINVVVNCAGIGTAVKVIGKKGPLPIGQFESVLKVNLVGTMNTIRLAAEKMLDNVQDDDGERGVIINTASVAAFDGQIGQAAYSASKAGVVGMTLPIAREFADYGIRVNTIAPGLFLTPMLSQLPEKVQQSLGQMVPFPKRLGHPAEFALLVRQIIENKMLNGETIRLDGGIRMAPK